MTYGQMLCNSYCLAGFQEGRPPEPEMEQIRDQESSGHASRAEQGSEDLLLLEDFLFQAEQAELEECDRHGSRGRQNQDAESGKLASEGHIWKWIIPGPLR